MLIDLFILIPNYLGENILRKKKHIGQEKEEWIKEAIKYNTFNMSIEILRIKVSEAEIKAILA